MVGVQVQDAEDFDFPLDIEIDAGGIGGPSAGLAFALDIVDELGEDITRAARSSPPASSRSTGPSPRSAA